MVTGSGAEMFVLSNVLWLFRDVVLIYSLNKL